MGEIGNDIVYPGAFATEFLFGFFFFSFQKEKKIYMELRAPWLHEAMCIPVLGRSMLVAKDSLPHLFFFLFHLPVVSLSLPPNIHYIFPLKTKWHPVLTFLYTPGKYIFLCGHFWKQSHGAIENG